METPDLAAIRALRHAWNDGLAFGQNRPLTPKHVWAIWVRPVFAEAHRALALFMMAIEGRSRRCDLGQMQVVEGMASGQIKEQASVLQSKTGTPLWFKISKGTRTSVAKRMEY